MSHTVYPHGALAPLAEGLWQVTGTHSLPVQRNMVVFRLDGGGLLLHSVVALDDAGMAALEALGAPTVMVIPHAKHAMDAGFYLERYPDLVVCCPGQSKKALERERDIDVDGDVDAVLARYDLNATLIPGCRFDEYMLELPVPGGVALVFCDALANDGRETAGVLGALMGVSGVAGGGFGVSRIMKYAMTVDRPALRAFIEGLSRREDVVCISVAHGAAILGDCATALREAAGRL